MICSQCVLDSSIAGISFNEKAVCNYCEALSKIPARTNLHKGELDKIINEIKEDGKNKAYDCVIGLSGGVDSSYVAYLVKTMGLRPIAVHLDNGWDAEIAVNNIHQICEKLDIDLYTHVVDWQEFRDIQKSFLKASLANAEIPTDHAITAILFKIARKYKVNYIIDGVNHATEIVREGFRAGGYHFSDLHHLKAVHKQFGSVKIKSYPTLSYFRKFYYRSVLKIKQVSILDYIDFNKQEAIKVLADKVNWKSYGGKHHESIFTKFFQVVLLPEKFNFDKRKIHLSDMILSGQISREEALRQLEEPPIPTQERKELISYFKKKMGYSDAEYDEMISAKPRSHKEFPNQEWIIDAYKKYMKK